MHAFCVGTVLEGGVLGNFLQTLRPGLSRAGINKELVKMSITSAILCQNASRVERLLGTGGSSAAAFPKLGGITSDQAVFLGNLLWHNRRPFMNLCAEQLLPGGSIFLLVIFHLTLTTPIPV